MFNFFLFSNFSFFFTICIWPSAFFFPPTFLTAFFLPGSGYNVPNPGWQAGKAKKVLAKKVRAKKCRGSMGRNTKQQWKVWKFLLFIVVFLLWHQRRKKTRVFFFEKKKIFLYESFALFCRVFTTWCTPLKGLFWLLPPSICILLLFFCPFLMQSKKRQVQHTQT